jgi:hypothetical protein
MINYILFAIFIALQIGDAWTTINVTKSGKGHEGNPIMAWVFSKIGLIAGFIVTKTVMLVVLGFSLYFAPIHAATFALIVFNGMYAYIVYLNYRILKS